MKDTLAEPAKLPSPGNPPGSGAARSSVSPPPTRPKGKTGTVGTGSPQNPEALSEREAACRLNPLTPRPAMEETGSTGACKPLNPGATPGSGAARKLIPPRPENSLEAPDAVGVYTTLIPGATLGNRAALKLLTAGQSTGPHANSLPQPPTLGQGLEQREPAPHSLPEPNQGEGSH
ncbi:hypothetical protein E2C01_073433 [Portunus trituberculatus]|uniref:Uncharacterized protein n=1 Tax=Portunus trituberculatus TaxID=210409 RepID=A0A5B7I9Q5_PORTR|nr:hypothetical protein [Portunus trituberculatus]